MREEKILVRITPERSERGNEIEVTKFTRSNMVDKKQVEYVANLARIEISLSEAEYLGGQLSKILGYIDKLKELDVEGVAPLRGLHTQNNIFRNDVAKDSDAKEAILRNCPQKEGNYFKIPKVIE
jgi:aspartyl-tRNA(Asn)/glutamyl-tRNA(Gln) amidotransferase subunit C